MSGLSKWAKCGVLAMVVADVVGILIVHDRLNRPALDVPSFSQEIPMAMNDTALTLPKDAAQVIGEMPVTALPKDGLQASGAIAQNDFQALPALSRIDPLPAPMRVEPLALDTPRASLKVAREMQMALRAPVIPTVRIAELNRSRKAARTFSSAFSNDISVSTQIMNQAPTATFAAPSAAIDAVDLSASADVTNVVDARASEAENTSAPVQAQSAVPVPEFGGTSEVPQPQLDLQPAPAAPEARSPATGEIPAS